MHTFLNICDLVWTYIHIACMYTQKYCRHHSVLPVENVHTHLVRVNPIKVFETADIIVSISASVFGFLLVLD